MGNSIWGPYGAHMDVPRWVPDESLLQNPHRSHKGCPYTNHIITHLGPIWVPYSLLAGLTAYFSNLSLCVATLDHSVLIKYIKSTQNHKLRFIPVVHSSILAHSFR